MIRTLEFYLRFLLIVLWLFFTSTMGLLLVPFFFRNTKINHRFAHWFSWGVLKLSKVRISSSGLGNLAKFEGPAVYVANHQSGLDMATFGRIYPPETAVIGKKELIYIPFFGFFFWIAGNILINRQNKRKAKSVVDQVVHEIRTRKISVWMFPEGTRNRSGEGLLPFKKGAFHMAIQSQVPIVPFISSPLKGVALWKEKRIIGGDVRLKVLPPISTAGMTIQDVDRLMSQTRDAMLEGLKQL